MPLNIRRESGENEIKCSHLNIVNTFVKKLKISSNDFKIPKYVNYNLLYEYNYSIIQLKIIAKYYKLSMTGNKQVLTQKIFKFLQQSNYAVKIQSLFRRYLQKAYNFTHGPGFLDRTMCNNATDFYTMDEMNEIPLEQFFSYKDVDGFIYGFDILSLYNLIITGGKEALNPYNRKLLPDNTVSYIRNKIRLSNILKIPIDIVIDKQIPTHDLERRIEMRALTLFQDIDSLGNYSNSEWFTSLDRQSLIRYLRELMDIWNYRAQLSSNVKNEICPPNGDPLRNTSMGQVYNLTLESLQQFILGIMENLVSNGINRDSKALGAYYVLAPLTLVNNNAAEFLPWLYQSVVYN